MRNFKKFVLIILILIFAMSIKIVYGNGDVVTVYNFEQWKSIIDKTIENADESVSMSIKNYDSKIYDIKLIDRSNASVSMKGYLWGSTANVTYKFNYHENYKLIRASEDASNISNLDESQMALYNIVKTACFSVIDEGMSDYEKEKALHDYLVLKSVYDLKDGDYSHNIRNIIDADRGVCDAYAYTFKMLCDFAGIPCKIVIGSLENVAHAWNVVKIEDKWYYVDVTNDDSVPDIKGKVKYDFFNLTQSDLQAKGYVWDTSKTPVCDSNKYNYFVYNNLLLKNMTDMKNLIEKNVNSRKKTVIFRTEGFAISNINQIKGYFNSAVVSGYTLEGVFGKEGVYTLTINYK